MILGRYKDWEGSGDVGSIGAGKVRASRKDVDMNLDKETGRSTFCFCPSSHSFESSIVESSKGRMTHPLPLQPQSRYPCPYVCVVLPLPPTFLQHLQI